MSTKDQQEVKSSNVVWHHATVTRQRREKLHKHRGGVLWFTGFSGAGKSTLAHSVEEQLYQHGMSTYVLDGDNVRHGLCGDLSFTDADRQENIRRISHLAQLFAESGLIVLTAFISPFQSDRQNARKIIGDDFHEIYCDCSIEMCEKRDVKGLYRRARRGEIKNFTGIDSPYEAPEAPELRINTESGIEESSDTVFDYVLKKCKL